MFSRFLAGFRGRIIIIFLFRGEITPTPPQSVAPVDAPRPPLRPPPAENTYIGPGVATRLPAAFYFVARQTARRPWGLSLFSFFFFNVALSGWKCLGIRLSSALIVLAYDWRALGMRLARFWPLACIRLARLWPLACMQVARFWPLACMQLARSWPLVCIQLARFLPAACIRLAFKPTPPPERAGVCRADTFFSGL